MSTLAYRQTSAPAPIIAEPGKLLKRVSLTVLILAAVVATAWAIQSYRTWRSGEAFRNYVTDVENLFTALQQYKERLGAYPTGNNADIAKALSGKNSKSVIVIVSNRIPTNEKGEFKDQWGTPLMIYFAGNAVLVRSAGPNRKFEDSRTQTSDDIVLSN
jgi:hypothetical protein